MKCFIVAVVMAVAVPAWGMDNTPGVASRGVSTSQTLTVNQMPSSLKVSAGLTNAPVASRGVQSVDVAAVGAHQSMVYSATMTALPAFSSTNRASDESVPGVNSPVPMFSGTNRQGMTAGRGM